jgi:hypothetical protein
MLTATAASTQISPGVYKLGAVLMILHARVLRPNPHTPAKHEGTGHSYTRPAKTAKKKGYRYRGALRGRTTGSLDG